MANPLKVSQSSMSLDLSFVICFCIWHVEQYVGPYGIMGSISIVGNYPLSSDQKDSGVLCNQGTASVFQLFWLSKGKKTVANPAITVRAHLHSCIVALFFSRAVLERSQKCLSLLFYFHKLPISQRFFLPYFICPKKLYSARMNVFSLRSNAYMKNTSVHTETI